MNTQDAKKMLDDLREGDRDEMDFVVKRDKVVPGETFSREALEELNASVNAFVSARIWNHWERRGLDQPGPTNIKVEVKVTIDDKHYPPLDVERPWFVIDGRARNAAN